MQNTPEEVLNEGLRIASLLPRFSKLPAFPNAAKDMARWKEHFKDRSDFLSYITAEYEHEAKRQAFLYFEWVWKTANALVDFAEDYRERAACGVRSANLLKGFPSYVFLGVGRGKKSAEHKIVLEHGPFMAACVGQDIRLFRRCERDDCERLYLAGRIDQRFCSVQCRNVASQRSYRSKIDKINVEQAQDVV